MSKPILTIIPCLNEAATMARLLAYLLREAETCPMRIVVADGGSTDGTVAIIQAHAQTNPIITYLPNPKRIQSAAINLPVATYGAESDYLIRIDAHADYPPGFCRTLVEDALATNADSVVVAMRTIGHGGFQTAVAAAQNSKLGNGGSAHRSAGGEGKFVDHGHHALMRMSAFTAVSGYDETFTHNEDAELDLRLRKAGFNIWLTAKTTLDYHPRADPWPLFKQYRNYGRGRARTLMKHHAKPRLRQLLPVAVAPAALLFMFSFLWWGFALPLVLWAGLCCAYGCFIAHQADDNDIFLAGPAAMIMHFAWSLGFWQAVLMERPHE